MTTLALTSTPGAEAAEISGGDGLDWTFVYTVMLCFAVFSAFLHLRLLL